ncbi:MAG: SDR family oxidoreductase [Clostridia bacterium]|jgi:NAD(P)-dependent dehydrogenase (short-subunit alcohol dehydrogenase family)|nr:SDR family oxidoreductase [Clostridia bacterium]MBT7123104.1 SDR family oxidoreductase [Clostridia bacterium]
MSLSTDSLKGKVCVVTGAAKSIGLAIAVKYAEQGAKVALIDIDPLVEKSVEELVAKGYEAKSYILNITDRDAVLKCFEQIVADLGDIYALVNNAGVVDTRPFEENDEAVFEKMFKVNVYGTAYCIQGALPSMKKTGGKIINFASKSGKTGSALMGPYSAAKGAVIVLTQSLAFEYAKYGITVNSICPGITDATGVWSSVSAGYIESMGMQRDEIIEKFTAKIPLGRLTDIQDVVDFVFFLTASGEYCTGQAYNITGGREMH